MRGLGFIPIPLFFFFSLLLSGIEVFLLEELLSELLLLFIFPLLINSFTSSPDNVSNSRELLLDYAGVLRFFLELSLHDSLRYR